MQLWQVSEELDRLYFLGATDKFNGNYSSFDQFNYTTINFKKKSYYHEHIISIHLPSDTANRGYFNPIRVEKY